MEGADDFSPSDLYAYYQSAKPLSMLNESARQDNYWVGAVVDYTINHIKISWTPLVEKGEYSIPWFEPPYFVVPQALFDRFLGLSLRGYSESSDYNLNILDGCYGYSSYRTRTEMDDFEKEDPIILSEGIMDAEALSQFYPWSFSSLGAFPSRIFLEILTVLTSKIVYVPDNDDAGDATAGKLINRAKYDDLDAYVDIFNLPDCLDDAGDLFKKDLMDSKMAEHIESRLKTKIHRLNRKAV